MQLLSDDQEPDTMIDVRDSLIVYIQCWSKTMIQYLGGTMIYISLIIVIPYNKRVTVTTC